MTMQNSAPPTNKENQTPGTTGTPNETDQQQQQTTQQIEDFESWLTNQDEAVRTAYTQHTSGLRSALSTERDARKDLEKQLRALAKNSEKDSNMESQLTKMADDLAGTQQQLDFYEEAAKRGIPYLDVAYATAVKAQAIDQRGRIDWKYLEESYPIIFKPQRPPVPNANSGRGSKEDNQPQTTSMNDWIRNQAGRG